MNFKKKISIKAKEKIIDFFLDKPLLNSYFLKNMQNTIIMYHGIISSEKNIFNTRHVGVNTFTKQMLFLKKYCNIISLSDFNEKKFIDSKINIAITFDDGYENNFTLAKPILEEMKIPATFFVTGLNEINEKILWADHLDIVSKYYSKKIIIDDVEYINNQGNYFSIELNKKLEDIVKNNICSFEFKQKIQIAFKEVDFIFKESNYFEYWKLMTDLQISKASESKFIEIGSHGYYHNNLGNLSINEAKDEIIKSKNYLNMITQKEIISMGYPDGSYSRETIDFCSKIGFKTQVAAEGFLFEEDKSDERILDREGIYCNGGINTQIYTALKKR